ncbi:DUF5606 domain-containing protein [Marinilabiliaceae bacterium ANBcel2]|nr:DUF5606 domain-containing protein [Marinilabiliaceae bacterium ANBcel2]
MVKDILAISGQPGLFKLVSQARNSIIVESLRDGKKSPAYSTSRISALEDISIYTDEGDVILSDIFIKIFESDMDVDPKSDGKTLKSEFQKVLPDYDEERVYVSDIKKIFSWYKILKEKGLITAEAIEKYKKDKEEEEKNEKNESGDDNE